MTSPRIRRPVQEYEVLAATGAKWMGMRDAGISFRPPSPGTIPPGYVEGIIEQLAPVMNNMSQRGLLDKMYVYGFDEMPEAYVKIRGTPPLPYREPARGH